MYKLKKLLSYILMAFLLVTFFPAGQTANAAEAAGTLTYYVSPTGNDNNDGASEATAFKTIQKAKDTVRAQIAAGMSDNITVLLRGGSYYLDSSITFDENDSGRDGYKVIYENYPGENPVIYGGQPLTGWTADSGGVYKTTVGTDWKFNNLVEAGVRAVKARYPDNGYLTVSEMVTSDPKHTFKFADGAFPAVADITGLEAGIWPGGPEGIWNWYEKVYNVTALDSASRTVTLSKSTEYDMGAGSRYFMQGAREFLNRPGEYYLDSTAGVLYYYPYNAENLEAGTIIAPKVYTLINVQGSSETNIVSNITFNGIAFDASDFPDQYPGDGGNMIELANAGGITVSGCKISNAGCNAISLYGWAQNNTIKANLISDIGVGGIYLSGASSTCSNGYNLITNNHIYNIGCTIGDGSGIDLWDSGYNTISHNRIHDVNRMGIRLSSMAGNPDTQRQCRNNTVEYNDVYDCMKDSQDGAAVYAWGAPSGNIIKNNLIHDYNINFSIGFGVYLDDYTDGTLVENNIIYGLGSAGTGVLSDVFNVKGIGNVLKNNIAADNDASGNVVTSSSNGNADTGKDQEFERNIFYKSAASEGYLYESPSYDNTQWRNDRYAKSDYNLLYNENGNYNVNIPKLPELSSFSAWREWQNYKYDNYTKTEDAKFMDAANRDYRLRYDSAAHSLGIADIDAENIGLTGDFPFSDTSEAYERLFIKSDSTDCGQATLNLAAGGTAQLKVSARTASGSLVGDAAADTGAVVTFNASDITGSGVVTVSADGVVDAVNSGLAKIMATVTKASVTKTIDIYVTVDDTVGTLQINSSKPYVEIGGDIQLQVEGTSVYGQRTDITGSVTYSSSDAGVAAIDPSTGIVTGTAAGEATITAAALGDPSKTASIVIRVIDFAKSLKELSINSEKYIYTAGETGSLTLAGKLQDGSDADLSGATAISLISSDDGIVNIDSVSGTTAAITAVAEGKATITATATLDGMIKTVSKVITVFPVSSGTGGEDWTVRKYGSADGYVTGTDGSYTLVGSGLNVWDAADDFTYLSKSVSVPAGDTKVTLTATISSFDSTSGNAAVGLMFRDKDTADSKNVHFRFDGTGALRYVFRNEESIQDAATGGAKYWGSKTGLLYIWDKGVTLPVKLKLVKQGNTVTGYFDNGTGWEEMGSTSCEFTSDSVLAGVGLFSGDTTPVTAGISDLNVAVENYDSWSLRKYGSADGYVSEDSGSFTIMGSGSNVWGSSDEFAYLSRNVGITDENTQVTMTATFNSFGSTSGNAAIGLMFRDKDTADSKNVHFRFDGTGALRYVFRNEESIQDAASGGAKYWGSQTGLLYIWDKSVTLPVKLKMVKLGNTVTGYFDKGSGWEEMGTTSCEFTGGNILVGIGLYSGDTTPISAVVSGLDVSVEQVDTTPPATTIALTGTKNNGWYTGDVAVTLSADDNFSGVAATEYRLGDSGDWTVYSGAFTLGNDGVTIVQYRSTDKAGNTEEVKSETVSIDKSAPAYTLQVDGISLTEGMSIEDDKALVFNVKDELSGVVSAQVVLDGKSNILDLTKSSAFKAGFAGKPGKHTVKILAEDTAGNRAEASFSFNVATSISAMKRLVARYKESGDIGSSRAKQLNNSLDKAQQQLDKGHPVTAAVLMADFLIHLNIKSKPGSNYISKAAKDVLNADANALIKEWTKKDHKQK